MSAFKFVLFTSLIPSIFMQCSDEQTVNGEKIYWSKSIQSDPKYYYSEPLCIINGIYVLRECDFEKHEFLTKQPDCESLQDGSVMCYNPTSFMSGQEQKDFCYVISDTILPYDEGLECPYNRLYIQNEDPIYKAISMKYPIWIPWKRNDVDGGVGDFISEALIDTRTIDAMPRIELTTLVSSTEDVLNYKCLSLYNGVYSANCDTPRYHVCIYESSRFTDSSYIKAEREPDFCKLQHANVYCRTSWEVGLHGITCICAAECETPAVHPMSVDECAVGVEVNKSGVLVWSANQLPVETFLWSGEQAIAGDISEKFVVWQGTGWVFSDEPNNWKMCETFWSIKEPILELSYDTKLKVNIQHEERVFLRAKTEFVDPVEVICYSHLDMGYGKKRLSEIEDSPSVGVWQCAVYDIANMSNIIRSNKVTVFGSKVYYIVEITCNKSLSACASDLESTYSGVKFVFSPITRLNLIISDGVTTFDQTFQVEIKKEIEDSYETLKANMKSTLVQHLNPRTYHLEYCEEFMVVQNGHELYFAQVSVNQVSKTTCYDEQGYAIKVTCIEDHSRGARFSAVPDCHTFESNRTTELSDLETSDDPPEEIIRSLIEILQDEEYPFQSVDLNKTANILENIGHLVPKEDLIESINILMTKDATVFNQAQIQLNVSDRVLDKLDMALSSAQLDYNEEITESENIVSVLMSEKSYYRGVGLTSANETILIMEQTLDELLELANWEVVAYLNYTLEEDIFKTELSITSITLFHSTVLFNEPSSNSLDIDYQVYRRAFSILIPEHYYQQSEVEVLLIFPSFSSMYQQTECAFWYYGQLIKGSWKTDSQSFQSNAVTSKYTICTFNHTTHFGQLLMTQNILTPISDGILSMMTLILCSISSLGLVIIFFTAMCFPSWGKNQLRTLNFCLILLMQTVLLIIGTNYNSANTNSIGCIVLGTCLHFVVLSQFCWMVVLAHRQYQIFVKVYNTKSIHIKWILLFTWGLPAAIVTITLAVNKNTYGEDNLESMSLCYPSGYTLISTILAPACLAMVINIIIYFRIIYELHCKNQNKTKMSSQFDDPMFLLKLRLFAQLFFTLGINWWFGIFAFVFDSSFFLYCFSITTPMQGFVLFLYIIIADKKVRNMYIRSFKTAFRQQ